MSEDEECEFGPWTPDKMFVECEHCHVGVLVPLGSKGPYLHSMCAPERRANALRPDDLPPVINVRA
jgi:hypothetical protein